MDNNASERKVSDYLRDIKASLIIYTKILNPSFPGDRSLEESLKSINRVGAKEAYPLLMSLISLSLDIEDGKNVHLDEANKTDFRKYKKTLLRQIENLSFRFLICRRADSHEVSVVYAKTSRELRNNPLESMKKAISELKNQSPEDRVFEQEFANFESQSRRLSLYILHKIETSMRGVRELLSTNPKEITLEHIMPQKLDSSWKRVERYHKKYLNRIGNLTLLSAKLNRTNASFGRKKNKYYSSSEVYITKLLVTYPKWGKNQINDRQKILAEQAVGIWSI